jgi:hypothetical protein
MSATLRPMNLGEILDRAFEIYRKRFWVLVGLAAMPALGTMLVEVAAFVLWGPGTADSLDLGFGVTTLWLGSLLAFYHFGLFFQLLLWPSFAIVVSDTLGGPPISISFMRLLKSAFSEWRQRMVLGLLLLLLTLVIPEVTSAGLLVGTAGFLYGVLKFADTTMDAVMTPILICCLLGGWIAIGWSSAIFSFTFPAHALEGQRGRAALHRARRLSQGSRLRLLTAWLMPALIGWMLSIAVLQFLLQLRAGCELLIYRDIIPLLQQLLLAAFPTQGWCVPWSVVESLRLISEVIITTLLGPIFPIAFTLIYYDQRIRREGYDIEKMMEAAGLGEAGAPGGKVASIEAEPQETEA